MARRMIHSTTCCAYFSTLGSQLVGSTVDEHGDYTSPASGPTIDSQDMSDCAGETALLSSGAWGFPTWWEEDASRAAGGVGTTSIHYINFKITRYEMGPFFGMQLYSTNHGTVLVRPNGTTSFKLLGHAPGLSIPLNESLVFTPPTVTAPPAPPLVDGTGRRLEEGATSRIASLEHSEREYHRARLVGACHPMHGCKQLKKVGKVRGQAAEDGAHPIDQQTLQREVVEAHPQRRRLRRGGALMTSGQFTLGSASNRCGNS